MLCRDWILVIDLERFNSWQYGPYALFQGIGHQDRVSIRGTIERNELLISPTTIATALGCLEDGLVFDKDQEKEITQKIVDIMLYRGLCLVTSKGNKRIIFLRTTNLTYMCRLIV